MARNRASELYSGGKEWQLAVRLCGRLIADGGRTRRVKVHAIAREVGYDDGTPHHTAGGKSRGTRAAQAIYVVMLALEELGLARRDGPFVVVADLAEEIGRASWRGRL